MADREDYVSANREAWNEVAPRHAAHNQERLVAVLAAGGYNHLEPTTREFARQVGIVSKSVVQVACNNGIDLLSMKTMGAGRGVGIDQAPGFIDQARDLARAGGFDDDVSFIEADIYDLPPELKGAFDVALTTIGVIYWMPDLDGFFEAVAKLIGPGGSWIMEETHPVLQMYEEDARGGPSYLAYSYFRTEPFRLDDGLDYFGKERYDAHASYHFVHKMSDIVNAGVKAGLVLERMEETGQDISAFCADLEPSPANPPMGLYLLWRKPA